MLPRTVTLCYCSSCRHATFHRYKAGVQKMWQICDFCGNKDLLPMPGAHFFSLLRTAYRINRDTFRKETLTEWMKNGFRRIRERMLP